MQFSPAEIKAIRRGKHVRRRLLKVGMAFFAVGMVWLILERAGVVGVLHMEAHALLVSTGLAVLLSSKWFEITPYDILQRYLNRDPEALRQLAPNADEPVAARR